MPNYCNTKSEKLMTELTEKLNMSQNSLFSELLEENSMMGVSLDDLETKYKTYQELSEQEIEDTFRDLKLVLIQHEQDSKDNLLGITTWKEIKDDVSKDNRTSFINKVKEQGGDHIYAKECSIEQANCQIDLEIKNLEEFE